MLSPRVFINDKYYTTDASPRIFNMVDYFNRHSELIRGVWDLVGKLHRQKYLKLMADEDWNELMRLVNKEICRI